MIWTTIIKRNIPWQELEALQRDLIQKVKENSETAFFLVSEPTPTFTHGRFASPEDRLWSEEKLRAEGAETYAVSRGGRWTFHGPGQILIYPIVRLEQLGLSRRAAVTFVGTLRTAVRESLSSLGVTCEERSRPFGLYLDGKKIVSFGLDLEGGIASHGLALYLEDQSRFFPGIRPCGASCETVTSLRESGYRGTWEMVAATMTERIKISLNPTRKGLG